MLEGGEVTLRDLEPFRYPSKDALRALGYRSICLGTYRPWDVQEQARIIEKELGWEGDDVEGVPPGYRYEKIECAMQGVRDYLRFIKRGMGRTNHLASIAIRDGRLSRDEGLRLVEHYDGKRPASLDAFLALTNLSEAEFMEIATEHVVAPHRHDPNRVTPGVPLPDQKDWRLE
jgi:hypothetical protein